MLDRFLAQALSAEAPFISMDVIRAFVARRGDESETTRAHRLSLIRQVCRFLALEDQRTAVPGPRWLNIRRRTFLPRVLTLDEGRRFLDASATLRNANCSPVRGVVLGTALVLLYLTGLRAGELLRLTDSDVDLAKEVLQVRNSKFGKSRLVPIASDVATRLRICRSEVEQRFGPIRPEDPFFPSPRGGPYSITGLHYAFHQMLAAAQIPRRHAGRPLRLHDLRHSFAVHRLALWFRQHRDVGADLPVLATYLGHVGLASSQRYLQLTEDLVGEVTGRFDARFGHLIDDGGRS